uniref:Uncharacterized protein n=1 Tax=Anguilla anguilla TaxID=7936 RepID=A0A0E9SPE7_ANGAN
MVGNSCLFRPLRLDFLSKSLATSCISEGVNSRNRNRLAPSGTGQRVLCHRTSSSSMNQRFFFPSVPCNRSQTYSAISSPLSMDRMY